MAAVLRAATAAPIVIAAAVLAGCGADVERAAAPPPRATAATDPRCPAARPPETRSPPIARAPLARDARRFGVSARTLQGFRFRASFSLEPGRVAGLDSGRYRRRARQACGVTVADRSWVIVIDMPNAPDAAHSQLAIFSARTAHGDWAPWLGWAPAAHAAAPAFPAR